MKHFFSLSLGLVFAFGLCAQQVISITPEQYQELKDNRQLDADAHYVFVAGPGSRTETYTERVPAPVSAQSTTCNCMIPLDTTFSVVPFTFGTPPEYRNDDGSTNPITLPFSFNFFGVPHDSIYINNNGNISFGQPYGTFSATGFPSTQYSMVAPFWADVDTRSTASGLVYYKITPTALIIRWDSVGYYSMHTDKRSTFQLIITDGFDTLLPPNTNVSFCYGDMQWTTGDASSGVNGFGGTPSTTGVNQGNGVDYFQATQSDDSTSNFDGPYGTPDGVSWLDDLEMTFNTSLLGNVPPLVMNNLICDTIDIFTGDTIRISAIDSIEFEFYGLTPEITQSITMSIATNAPAGALSTQLTLNGSDSKTFHCVFDARNLSPGTYTVTVTATDNGTPALTSTSTVYIHTHYDSTTWVAEQNLASEIRLYPNPTDNVLNVDHSSSVKEIKVTDLNGAVISVTPATANRSTVNTSTLPAGIYFVQIVNADGSVSVSRFVKY
jgi:hypothetical protein